MDGINYDYLTRRYVIKYQIGNQEVVTYLSGDAMRDEIMEWRAYHMGVCRDLAIKKLTEDDTFKFPRHL
jgi:hypothetical protein